MAIALGRLERANQSQLRGLADNRVERVGPLLVGARSASLGLLHGGHQRSSVVARLFKRIADEFRRGALANVNRQIFDSDSVVLGHQDGALNRMSELADVAG